MIERDDLRAAVSAGVVSEAQAARLIGLADARRGARESLGPGDEPFELFKGFNEIFIVVGLVILATGWAGVAGLAAASGGLGDYFSRAVVAGLLGAAVIWLLAEYFTSRRRMVAPVDRAAPCSGPATLPSALPPAGRSRSWSRRRSMPASSSPLGMTTLALLVYWARFRVPFAMALIALGAFATVLVFAADRAGTPASPSELFLLSAEGPFAWITLALGLVVFARRDGVRHVRPAPGHAAVGERLLAARRRRPGAGQHAGAVAARARGAPTAGSGPGGRGAGRGGDRPAVVPDRRDRLLRDPRLHRLRRSTARHGACWCSASPWCSSARSGSGCARRCCALLRPLLPLDRLPPSSGVLP